MVPVPISGWVGAVGVSADTGGTAGRGIRLSQRGNLGGHFTTTPLLSDATGAFLGSVTVDGYPEVSADGQSSFGDGSKVMATIRDATGAIVQQMPGAGVLPVTGIRMAPGTPASQRPYQPGPR
jgi:hypothetical protein